MAGKRMNPYTRPALTATVDPDDEFAYLEWTASDGSPARATFKRIVWLEAPTYIQEEINRFMAAHPRRPGRVTVAMPTRKKATRKKAKSR